MVILQVRWRLNRPIISIFIKEDSHDEAVYPQLVYFEPDALHYPLGQELKEKFEQMGIEIRYTTSHNQVRNLPGDNDFQKYRVAKSTLVVGIRKH